MILYRERVRVLLEAPSTREVARIGEAKCLVP
jgi:hypothetical protein